MFIGVEFMGLSSSFPCFCCIYNFVTTLCFMKVETLMYVFPNVNGVQESNYLETHGLWYEWILSMGKVNFIFTLAVINIIVYLVSGCQSHAFAPGAIIKYSRLFVSSIPFEHGKCEVCSHNWFASMHGSRMLFEEWVKHQTYWDVTIYTYIFNSVCLLQI